MKVMGWESRFSIEDDTRDRWVVKNPEGSSPIYVFAANMTWAPHESISDAWEVVEKLLELGFDSWCIGDDEVYFEDSSTIEVEGVKYRFGAAIPGSKVAIPEAICRAALTAVGVE